MLATGFTCEQLNTVLSTWLMMMMGTVHEVELLIKAEDVTPEIKRALTRYFEEEYENHSYGGGKRSVIFETLPDGGKRVVYSWASFRS